MTCVHNVAYTIACVHCLEPDDESKQPQPQPTEVSGGTKR